MRKRKTNNYSSSAQNKGMTVSEYCRRKPSSSAGFFSGTNASLTRDKDNRKILNESGINAVRKSFIEWEYAWLDNLDVKFYTLSDNSIIKIK